MFNDRFFLFTEAGPSKHSVVAASAMEIPSGTWALANSSDFVGQPCSAFLAARRNGTWIIQATLPKRSRWFEWSKQQEARFYVMDWFTPYELEVLGWVHDHAFGCLLTLSTSRLLGLDTTKLLSNYRTWGPCARTCVNLVRGRLKVERHSTDVSNAAAKFVSSPQSLLGLVREFNADEVLDVLLFVRPTADSRGHIRAEVPTKHLSSILALAVARVDAAQQSQFFSLISSHPIRRILDEGLFMRQLVEQKE